MNYRIEIRFDFEGTEDEARQKAQSVAGDLDGEVSAIFDENWEEL